MGPRLVARNDRTEATASDRQPYIPKAFRLSQVSDLRLKMGDRLDLYPEP